MELDPVIVAAIDAHLSRPDRYQAIITTIANKVHNNKDLFDIYKTYLEGRLVQIIKGKTKAEQLEILGTYHLPLVYLNQLIARTTDAAPAAAIENENLVAAAEMLQALRKGGKSHRRRKSYRRRKSHRRR